MDLLPTGPLAVGLAALLAYVMVVWRSARQEPPELSHGGLRWLVWHASAIHPGSVIPMLGVLALLSLGWGVIAAVAATLASAPASGALGLDVLAIAPGVGALTAVLTVPWWVARSWTRLEATPAELRLIRPWPHRPVTLRWRQVRRVREGRQALVLKTTTGDLVLDAPRADPSHLRQVAAWLQATREAPAEPVAVPPPPAALHQLVERSTR